MKTRTAEDRQVSHYVRWLDMPPKRKFNWSLVWAALFSVLVWAGIVYFIMYLADVLKYHV